MYYFFVTLEDVNIKSLSFLPDFDYDLMSTSFFDFLQYLDFNDFDYTINFCHTAYLDDNTFNKFLSDDKTMVYYFKNSNVWTCS